MPHFTFRFKIWVPKWQYVENVEKLSSRDNIRSNP